MKIEVRGGRLAPGAGNIPSRVVIHVDPRAINSLRPSEYEWDEKSSGPLLRTIVGVNGGWFDAYEDCEALRLRIIDNGGIQLRHEGDSQRPPLTYTGWP